MMLRRFSCGRYLVIHFLVALLVLDIASSLLKQSLRTPLSSYRIAATTEYSCRIINYKTKSEKTLKISSKKLILDVAESHLDLPAQCRGGICNTCIGKLISGSVDQFSEQDNILGEKAISAGYVLTCVAKPTSDLEMYVDMELEYVKDHSVW